MCLNFLVSTEVKFAKFYTQLIWIIAGIDK